MLGDHEEGCPHGSWEELAGFGELVRQEQQLPQEKVRVSIHILKAQRNTQ